MEAEDMREGGVTYVGVDIGWSVDPKPDTTGLCTIRDDRITDLSITTTDYEIISYVLEQDAEYVGVDAPLVVENVDGRRPVEDELHAIGYPGFPAQRDFFERAYGGVRGEDLVTALEAEGYELAEDTSMSRSVIEVYPNPTMQAIVGELPPYKKGRKAEKCNAVQSIWSSMVVETDVTGFDRFESMVPTGPSETTVRELDRIGDQVDAFFSAYVLSMNLDERGNTRVLGDLETGSILTALPDGV